MVPRVLLLLETFRVKSLRGADLPSNWSPEEFTRMVIGEEEVLDPENAR